MNTIIWIIQGITAVMFIMAGLIKSTQSQEKLEPKLPWVKEYSIRMVRFVGIVELLGGIGLILPQLTGLLPILTPVAAAGLATVMVLAAAYHFRRKEYKAIAFNTVLFVFALLIAVYRF